MNLLDIIILIILIIAAILGAKRGIAIQLGGILGIIGGVYFAYRYSIIVGRWFTDDPLVGEVVGFIVVLLVVVIGLVLLGMVLKKVFKFAGLGMFDKIGGAVLSVFKVGILLSILLWVFDIINYNFSQINGRPLVKQRTIDNSALYRPVRNLCGYVFPYIKFLKSKLESDE